MEVILHDTIVHQICLYLDIDDIIHMRQLSKLFCRKISKSMIYSLIRRCKEVKLDFKEKVKKQFNKMKEVNSSSKIAKAGLVIGGILLSPLLLVVGIVTAPITIPSIYRGLKELNLLEKSKKEHSEKYQKILAIYYKSLTDRCYFNITEYIIRRYHELVDKMDITSDLSMCVVFKNINCFDYLLGKYHEKGKDIPQDLLKLIINFDDVDTWKIVKKYFKDNMFVGNFFQILTGINDRDICFMPKLMQYGIESGHIFQYDEIYINSCRHGSLEMIKFLVGDKLVDIRYKNDMGFIQACKNKHIECAKYLSSQCDVYKFDEKTFKFIIDY